MNKNTIVGLASFLVIVGAVVGGHFYTKNHKTTVVENKVQTTESNSAFTVVSKPKNAVQIETQAPINGVLKGVVEVGASGFNSFVVNVDKDKNWELVSKDFGESLAYEGFATKDDVVAGLKKYIGNMFNKGVSGRNIHFVVSSGALKNPKTTVIMDGIKQMGYQVNEVTALKEGQEALEAALPKQYRDKAFVVDMGSGNTKVSWIENGRIKSIEGPGAKYFQNNISDDAAYNQIKDAVTKIPKNLTQFCFIIGGVPSKLASKNREGSERFTQLSDPSAYSVGDDVKIKSGLNIYRSVFDNSGCNNYIFDWDANFTIGFLLNLN